MNSYSKTTLYSDVVARPARYSDDDVLDAALAVVAEQGRGATVEAIATELGARVATVYHRFESRRELLAALWLRSIARFQARFLELARGDDAEEAAVAVARYIAEYCAAHPDEARALTLFRQEELAADCPSSLIEAATHVNDEIETAMVELTRRRFGHANEDTIQLMQAAIQYTPYGLVRPFIGSGLSQPAWLADVVAAAVPQMLAVGDNW